MSALPQQDFKYLGMHLDRRLAWHKRIFTKRKQLANDTPKYIGSLEGGQNSLQATKFLSKVLRLIVDAPWYINNMVI
jgi:hypothetical protein